MGSEHREIEVSREEDGVDLRPAVAIQPGAIDLKARPPVGFIVLATLCSVLVHGYHPFVEDAEIYVPGIKSY